MPMLEISASFVTEDTMPRETGLMTAVNDAVIARLIPKAPGGGESGWAYWSEAEELVCSLLKRKLFPDEITSVENAEDLRNLGVSFLKVTLKDELGNSNTLTLINDHGQAQQ
jgi:hypothetical protein